MSYLTTEDIERIEKHVTEFETEPRFISATEFEVKMVKVGKRKVQLQFRVEADPDEFI